MDTCINMDCRIHRTLLRVHRVRMSFRRQQQLANITSNQHDHEWNAGGTHEFTRSNFKQSCTWVASRASASINRWMSQCMQLALPIHPARHSAKDMVNGSTAATRTKQQRQGQIRYNTRTTGGWQTTIPPPMLRKDWPQPFVRTMDEVQKSSVWITTHLIFCIPWKLEK